MKYNEWVDLFSGYGKEYPELSKEIDNFSKGILPENFNNLFPVFNAKDGQIATRTASGKTINAIAPFFPDLIGGSADLEPSTDTFIKNSHSFQPGSYDGRNIHFGVREHSMGAILNGITLSKPMRAFGATFLIFSDYMKPSIRLAAIMGINPIYVFTHDSIALGEDGTTHQPVEQLVSLRSIPNMTVIRPADANETAQAWRVAIQHKTGPVALIFSRQKIPVIDQTKYASSVNLEKGAYILSDSTGKPDIIIIATGSEVSLALEVQHALNIEKINSRVVSMPSWELFERQSKSYKEKVLPPDVKKRISIEAGSVFGWNKYVTDEGIAIGMDNFGKSAPGEVLMKEYGFSVDHITAIAKSLIK